MAVRAAIFDVDGTLIDSNDAHARAWSDAFAAEGHTIPGERIRPLVGMGGDKVLPALLSVAKDSPPGKRLSARRKQIFLEQYLPRLKPFAGVADLLRRLHDDGLILGVASSSEPEELTRLLALTGVPELFQQTSSAEDASQSKPSPTIVQAALARCGVAAGEAVLIGDTAYDVAAGQDAGVAVIGVRCGGWSDDGLFGAAAIFADPAELLAQLDHSPLARRA